MSDQKMHGDGTHHWNSIILCLCAYCNGATHSCPCTLIDHASAFKDKFEFGDHVLFSKVPGKKLAPPSILAA